MKKYNFLIFILGNLVSLSLQGADNAITWNLPSGRTGDKLLSYCIAKWVSRYLNISLLVKPFKYSDAFVFSQVEQQYSKKKTRSLKQKKISFKYGYYKGRQISLDTDFEEKNTLFLVDLYFAHTSWYNFESIIKQDIIFPYSLSYDTTFCHKGDTGQRVRFNYMNYVFKADEKFFSSLKVLLKTREPLETVTIPGDAISVAVHVRKGGGYDQMYKSDQIYATSLNLNHYRNCFSNKNNVAVDDLLRSLRDKTITKVSVSENPNVVGYIDIVRPLKHPPDQYYIDQIKAIAALFKLPLFVYIFTDDQHPENIVAQYKKALNNDNIIFACRPEENNHYSNVLTDLYAMSKFDCLIRAYSSFSQMSQLIGNHKLVISPIYAVWNENQLIIDEILIERSKDFDDFIAQCKKKYFSK